MKAKVTVLGIEFELEGKNDKDLWQQVAFYQSLPTTCPIDNTPTRLGFRSPKGNDYYEVVNTNPSYYFTFHVGQQKEGGGLYASGDWSWWDWERKEEVALAKWSTLTDAGVTMRDRIQRPGAVDVAAHRTVQMSIENRSQLDTTLDGITVADSEPMAFDDEPPTKVRDWLATGDPVATAKAWAVTCKAQANDFAARNSLKKIVDAQGGRLTKDNMYAILTAYYFRQVEHLSDARGVAVA